MSYLTTTLLSLFITIALVPISARLAARLGLLDVPDQRKVHTKPIPRTGGLAMALGALIPIALLVPMDNLVRSYMIGVGIIVVFGVLDDFKNLGYKPKFFGQIVAALVVILYGGVKITSLGMLMPDDFLLPDWLAIPLTLVVIVGVINAINLSDGLDGLAGGICLISFCCIGFLGYRANMPTVALLSTTMLGVIFGFLRFNTHPATLFMGDTGSQFLGFSAITLSVALSQECKPFSPLLPLILLGFPILDTITVMTERIHKRVSPFVADNNHFHHKLMRIGLTHSESVLAIYIIQSILVVSAFLFRFHSEWIILGGYVLFSGLIVVAFYRADKTGWKIRRIDVIDIAVKGFLKTWKEQGLLIKILGRALEITIPLLFIISCFVPQTIPGYISWIALAFLTFLIILTLLGTGFIQGGLRNIYLLIPFALFLGMREPAAWMAKGLLTIYTSLFAVAALLIVLTLKFTRRRQGFRFNLMDFLILFIVLFIVLIVPVLVETGTEDFNVGLLSAKIVVLLFGYEVLIGELRGNYRRLVYPTLVSLAVLAVRGLI